MSETQLTGIKRRSRFDPVETEPEQKKTSLDVNAAAARAAELSKELSSKVQITLQYTRKTEINIILYLCQFL